MNDYTPKTQLQFAFSELTHKVYAIRGKKREDITDEFNRFVAGAFESLKASHKADMEKWEALRVAVNDLMAERYYAANDGALYCDSCHISRQLILTGLGHKPGCSVGDVEQALAALDAPKEQA